MNILSSKVELVGTDLSKGMLGLAAHRGERVLGRDLWRALPDNSFDGAISVFVLHFGTSRDDRVQIARQLRPGARFAANYFKADDQAIAVLVSDLADLGLELERIEPSLTTPNSKNPMLVFAKGGREC
jgi:ubiquinone/menaquinone biosynthesis C-methylase UbiE